MEKSCTLHYHCRYCSITFPSWETFKNHFLEQHPVEVGSDNLVYAYEEMFVYKPHPNACPTCFSVFPFKENLMDHISHGHCMHPLQCSKCGVQCMNMNQKVYHHKCRKTY